MAADTATMLRTAIQVQSALVAAYVQTVAGTAKILGRSAASLGRVAIQPVLASPLGRQTAIENAAWAAYQENQALLRGAAGLSQLSFLMFLNSLDRTRRNAAAAARPSQNGAPLS